MYNTHPILSLPVRRTQHGIYHKVHRCQSGFLLGLSVIPYLPRKDHFEMYIIKLGTGLIITVVYTAVLFMGLAAILFTLNALLGVPVPEKLYSYTGIILGCVFAPAYFLAGIPLKDHSLEDENYLTVLKALLLYIVIPLLTAYTTILYIYFIKIIVSWEWPSGLVSHLVLWYALIVTAVLFPLTLSSMATQISHR